MRRYGKFRKPGTAEKCNAGMETHSSMPDRQENDAWFHHLSEELQSMKGIIASSFSIQHSTMVSRKEFNEKEEECRKLKKENKALQEKFQSVLANAMKSHRFSEDLNDPTRESAVLERYHMLQTQQWAKAKYATSRSSCPLTTTNSGTVIQMVFSKCEENIKNRLDQISSLLQCPALTEASGATSSKQTSDLVREIRNHLRNLYFNNSEDDYRQLGEAALPADMKESEAIVKFAAECCRVYSLLFLQNPPITAEWHQEPTLPDPIAHTDLEMLKGTKFVWPILVSEGKVIKNGIVKSSNCFQL
ncbi:PREDICTED: uncharacterized protein LOC109316847 isoform X2 [Crocodylus porosus]|uniref:uncharacterized protein LOC109316847 isoform X2 n=1 Tax=Crocodylus porosus TaxID=8502 RepID=UPI00093D1A17|nr:PREDICTED: uncharacterized protein LOC109316847 isoform X2 [Crocodylus porosus]